LKKVISASRRTDLVAFFPARLAQAVAGEEILVTGPSGRAYAADLRPAAVHSFVLWSKNFRNLIENRSGLKDRLDKYDQLYFHFTITGLGGSGIERGVPEPEEALGQLEPLIALAGRPERVSLRFDPVIYWDEGRKRRTNLGFFETLAEAAARSGIRDIRFSFAQWYGKSKRRAQAANFRFFDPSPAEKKEAALRLAEIARRLGLNLYSCSQDFLTAVRGIRPSACIDGRLLQTLHPRRELVSFAKDKSQRTECRCTESVDIGSYTQTCPHSCIYCYANPK
jgi:DNA repair photolyase